MPPLQRKCTGRDIWDKFTATFDLNEQDFFGLQYEQHTGKGLKLRGDGGSYNFGQTTTQWLDLSESVWDQVGAPSRDETNDNEFVWDFEFRLKFYCGASVLNDWDDYAR